MTGLEIFTRFYPSDAALHIVDAGAHVGDSVASFLHLFPHATIHALEPAPDNHRRLAARFGGHSQVRLHRAALGPVDGTVHLHLNNYDATHSVLPIDREEISRWADSADILPTGMLDVPQVSLDRLSADQGLTRIDILKMDIQGGELAALQGARSALRHQQIGCIFSEVEFRALYRGQPLAWDLHRCLADYGYEFVNFLCPKVSEAGLLSWADAVYVNRSIWDRVRHAHVAGRLSSSL